MEFKHEIVNTTQNLPFRIFLFEGYAGKYQVEKHWHSSIELFLVLEGEIIFYINEQPYKLTAGKMILVNSNEVHRIDSQKENHTIVLQIPPENFDQENENETLYFHTVGYEKGMMKDGMISLYQCCKNKGNGYFFEAMELFYKILYSLYREHQIPADEEKKRQNRQLEKLSAITEYLRMNYRENVSLSQTALKFGFSTSYLSRMFQKYAKICYKDYLRDIRLNEARRQLQNTREPIGKIAEECGFPDSRSMAEAFRKCDGMLPSQIREKQEEKF